MRPVGLLFYFLVLAPAFGHEARNGLEAASRPHKRGLNQNYNTIVDLMVNFFGDDKCNLRTRTGRLSLICRDPRGSVRLVSTLTEDPIPVKLKVCEPIEGVKVCDTIYADMKKSNRI